MWEQGLWRVMLPLAASSPCIPVCFAGVVVDTGCSHDEGSDLPWAGSVAVGDPPGLLCDLAFPPEAVPQAGRRISYRNTLF